MDLRLLIPEENIDIFIDWFVSGENREITFEREFNEDLISLIPQEYQMLFNKIQAEKQKDGSFDIFFDEEKGLNSIKPMDIISINLNNEQKKGLRKVYANNKSVLLLASKDDILKGFKVLDNNTKVNIGNHSKNILPPQKPTLGS